MSSDREEAEADCGDPKFGFVDEMTSVVPFNLMLSGLPKSVIWIGTCVSLPCLSMDAPFSSSPFSEWWCASSSSYNGAPSER